VSRRGIVLAGTVILDIVHLIDHWPAEESVALVSRTENGAGGPPHNAAAGLVKLQAPFPVRCLGVVGDDVLGEQLVASATSYGLDVSGIRKIAGAVTSHTQVMTSQATGKRTFFHQVGVNAVMTAEMLQPPNDEAKIFYVGSPGIAANMDAGDHWRQLLRDAKSRGFVTALEMVPIARELQQKHVLPCLQLVDVLVINDGEAEDLTGTAVAIGGRLDFVAAERCCRKLLEMGVGQLAVVHHPDGAVGVAQSGEAARAGSVQVPQSDIAGTVGAGDAFYAGVLLGFHEGWDLHKCLALGNASAATSLHSPTTSASIRPWTECFSYALQCGVRAVAN
jgi:sugar/nucleoside kinase (ribokinase family)